MRLVIMEQAHLTSSPERKYLQLFQQWAYTDRVQKPTVWTEIQEEEELAKFQISSYRSY